MHYILLQIIFMSMPLGKKEIFVCMTFALINLFQIKNTETIRSIKINATNILLATPFDPLIHLLFVIFY